MKIDIKNKTFNSLTVIDFIEYRVLKNSSQKRGVWLCKCICGKYKEAFTGDITSGKLQSCGCRGIYNEKNEKICSICKQYLSIDNFYNRTWGPGCDCVMALSCGQGYGVTTRAKVAAWAQGRNHIIRGAI